MKFGLLREITNQISKAHSKRKPAFDEEMEDLLAKNCMPLASQTLLDGTEKMLPQSSCSGPHAPKDPVLLGHTHKAGPEHPAPFRRSTNTLLQIV